MMFWREPTSETTVNVNSSVHEHRAPTDESIRLLNEMQEKVRENHLASWPLQSNAIDARIWMDLEPKLDGFRLTARAMVNGQKVEAVVTVSDKNETVLRDGWAKLRAEFAEQIAQAVLAEPFANVVGQAMSHPGHKHPALRYER